MTRIYARATMRGWRGGFVFPALGRRRRAGRLCMTWRRGCRSATGCEPAIVTPLGPGARGTTDDRASQISRSKIVVPTASLFAI